MAYVESLLDETDEIYCLAEYKVDIIINISPYRPDNHLLSSPTTLQQQLYLKEALGHPHSHLSRCAYCPKLSVAESPIATFFLCNCPTAIFGWITPNHKTQLHILFYCAFMVYERMLQARALTVSMAVNRVRSIKLATTLHIRESQLCCKCHINCWIMPTNYR